MLQLELLYKLQCFDAEIKALSRELKDRTIYNRISKIKEDYNKLKDRIDGFKQQLDINNKSMSRLNIDLKCFDQKIKENSERLYEEGSSIRVIDNIQNEIENYRQKIDNTENEILRFIDINEKLNVDIDETKRELMSYKKEFDGLKAEYTEKIEQVDRKLEIVKSNRENVLKEIDENMINMYNGIAAKKSSPVSIVKDGTCTECGVKLNALLYDSLKKRNNLCTCDYCGRILYIE